MALFQKSVLKKYLKLQEKEILQKSYKKYTTYFHNLTIQENIKNSKEEEYQGIFLTELFVTILGYELSPKPNFNLVAEYKNQTNSRKADGAILKDGIALAVIELKGTKTKDLESIRKQAFDYKANQKGCVYVITSNFEKLRFYINDATEFEEFNLFTLTKHQFELLYLCLHKKNIFANTPLKIKEESVTIEEKITKSFYADYSLFKRELYRDLVKQNAKQLKNNNVISSDVEKSQEELDIQQRLEKNVKLTLFKKSQKLIDRFLFIFFAEDRGLLPPNSTIKILDDWNKLKELDAIVPLYNRFKLYFNYLDKGRKGTDKKAEIYAYNGGLFKPDTILDNIKIEDNLLAKHTRKLANYDFDSQVDVNILGHIFENSLNEIESVNAEIEGGDFDKQKSKRKKDGVFYTPKYITKYMVENTVGKLCDEKKQTLHFKEEEYFKSRKNRPKKKLKELVQLLDTYREWLLQLTICDPACGSGAFLNQALDFLIKEHRYIDELKANLLGGGLVFADIENTILENNIFGVDLNEESVEIAKLSLWLRTAQPRRKLNDLSSNIKCGNSLIDSKAVAGNKAFYWQTEFTQIFKEKDKKIYHITTAIHDSRTSARMIKYKVREKREMGTNPYPNVIYFTDKDDVNITQTIATIVQEDNLNMLAYNICADHIHLLIACDIEEIPKIMQKIKGRTSFMHKRYNGLKSIAEKEKEKEKKKPLWQQKYSAPKEVTTQEQLHNTINYIQKNRSKHELPEHTDTLKTTIQNMCCDVKTAMKIEYFGGFDVVIGNPPYFNMTKNNTDNKHLKYYTSQYYSLKNANSKNLYTLFNELSVSLIKDQGLSSFIIPEGFLKTRSYDNCVKFMNEKGVITNAIYFEDWVFEDATTGSMIFNFIKNKSVKTEIVEWLMNKNRELSLIKNIKNPIIERYNKLSFPKVSEICNVFKGMVVKNRKEYIFEERNNLPDKFYLGNCIDRNLIKNTFYCDYSELTIIGGTKKIEKHNINPRILIRRTGNFLCCVLLEEKALTESTLYSCSPKTDKFDISYLLSIFNSNLLTYIVRQKMITNEQAFPQILMSDILLLKIPETSLKKQFLFKSISVLILSLNKNLQEISQKFQRSIQRKFEIEKLSKKLQDWYVLTYPAFVKELAKKKVKLSLTEEAEWEDYFIAEQQKAVALKTQITQTDTEIDAMVYKLYELTEEEIQIVENS